MPNYKLGKVYKIAPISGGEEGDVYIGSTALPRLSTRMATHRCSYKRWNEGKGGLVAVYKIFEKYEVHNCQITLIESISAETKEGLLACERKWIQLQACVNKNVAGRTRQQYNLDNQEHLNRACKQYYQDNREHRIRASKQYYQDNRERIQQYRDQHADHKQQYNKTYHNASPIITCACGSSFKNSNVSIHVKSKKHQQFCTTIV
jgi:hypothetical protein